MFLTRIGPNAKAIITGDPTQVDLPKNQRSGLDKAMRILKHINGICTDRIKRRGCCTPPLGEGNY
jgi:phosphate starvation-inducible protein PhoH